MLSLIAVLAVITTILWATATFIERRLASTLGMRLTSLIVVSVGIIPITIFLIATMPPITSLSVGSAFFWLAALSGVFFAFGYVFFLKGVETEQVSNAVVINFVQIILLVLFGVFVLSETLQLSQIVGGAVLLLGVFLVSTKKEGLRLNRKLLPVFYAEVSWALYWIVLSYTIYTSGQTAQYLFVSRFIGAVLIMGMFSKQLFVKPKKIAIKKKSAIITLLYLGVLAGLLDGSGNSVFSYIAHLNGIALASIINLFGFIVTISLAYYFYGERLNKVQLLGVVIALAGAIITTIG